MQCPRCASLTSIVESALVDGGACHTRQCVGCGDRFTTLEQPQRSVVMVMKRDGRRERFQRAKLLDSLRVCARKRPLAAAAVDAIAEDIERRLAASGRSEAPSRAIGEMVIAHLRRLDPIAYIRYASVYRQFVSLDDMLQELSQIALNPPPPPEQPRLFEQEDFDPLLAAADAGAPRLPRPIGSARSAVAHS